MNDASNSRKSSEADVIVSKCQEYESIELATAYVRALEVFRDFVVSPSLASLNCQIDDNEQCRDEDAHFLESGLTDLHHATVQGYLLAVQAMWERGLRRLLVKCEERANRGARVENLYKAQWSEKAKFDTLQSHFQRLIGFPMQEFASYKDLDLLQNLGNAIRHGNGKSAVMVHKLDPSLWWNWFPPGASYNAGTFRIVVAADAPKHPSFDRVTLQEELLQRMIQSVLGFWKDFEVSVTARSASNTNLSGLKFNDVQSTKPINAVKPVPTSQIKG